jgi:hypothetical protein
MKKFVIPAAVITALSGIAAAVTAIIRKKRTAE